MIPDRRTDARLALVYVLPPAVAVLAFAVLAVAGVTPWSAFGAVVVAVVAYFVTWYLRLRRRAATGSRP